jgi:hypothetical protein
VNTDEPTQCTAFGCTAIAIERFVEMCEHEHRMEGFRCSAESHRPLLIGRTARCTKCDHICLASRSLVSL